MAFDLNKAGLGDSLKKGESIMLVPLDKISENEQNFYGIRGIDLLADSIRMEGLIEPVVLLKTGDGAYRLISGHRRYKAYQALAEEDGKFSQIPARIVRSMDSTDETLTLILANSTQRELTNLEKLQQEKMLREALMAMKAAGKDIPHSIGKYLADKMGTSMGEVSRMHSINENLIPEAMEKVGDGTMTMDAAYKMSRREPEEQKLQLQETAPAEDGGFWKQKAADNQRRIEKELEDERTFRSRLMDQEFDRFICRADMTNVKTRSDGIKSMQATWRNSGGTGMLGNSFSYNGSQSGIDFIGNDGSAFHIGFADLYDALCAEALWRAKYTPARTGGEDAEWARGGNPKEAGWYACIFRVTDTRIQRRCAYWDGSEWLNDDVVGIKLRDASMIEGFIALPEAE